METYQINRRNTLLSIIIKPFKLLLKGAVLLVFLPIDIIVHIFEPIILPSRTLAKKYPHDRRASLNHKHDNYQSQIDMLARKMNDLFLNDEAYNKQFNRLENKVKALDSTNDYLNHDRYDTLEAKVDKILSESSKLAFKPLTKEEEQSLEIAKGEAMYDDEVREYPSEPDFDSEQKAMIKQMIEVAKRDEEWEEYQRDAFENPEPSND